MLENIIVENVTKNVHSSLESFTNAPTETRLLELVTNISYPVIVTPYETLTILKLKKEYGYFNGNEKGDNKDIILESRWSIRDIVTGKIKTEIYTIKESKICIANDEKYRFLPSPITVMIEQGVVVAYLNIYFLKEGVRVIPRKEIENIRKELEYGFGLVDDIRKEEIVVGYV